MNEHDANNLKFIMNSTADELADWIKQMDEDDTEYALELINLAMSELHVQSLELMDDVEDLTEANNVIKMIMEK